MDSKRKKRIRWIIVSGFILIIGTYNALARFQFGRPQVIAAGVDPALVETDKPKPGAKILALIRPGSDPISTVQLIFHVRRPAVFPGQVTPVVATPILDFNSTGVKLGEDHLYSGDIDLDPKIAPQLTGLTAPVPWGTGEGEIAIKVTDKAGKTHTFPEVEFDTSPPVPYPATGYPVPGGYGAGYAVFQ